MSSRSAFLGSVTVALCLALSGCANDKKIVHTARMSDRSQRPAMTLHKDQGSSGAVLYGSAFMFGMPGLLISASAMGRAHARDLREWKTALGEQDEFFLKTLNQRVQAALERSGKLTFPKSAPVTMDIRFREASYGLRHRGKKQFSVVAEVQVVFAKGKDDEFYEFGEELESKTRATIPEFHQNPALFQRAVTEIADKLGSLIAEDYELPGE